MIAYSEAKKILPFNFWRRLSLFPFGGLKLNSLFFIILFIIDAKILLYVWGLANYRYILCWEDSQLIVIYFILISIIFLRRAIRMILYPTKKNPILFFIH